MDKPIPEAAVVQRHVVTKYRDGSTHVADVTAPSSAPVGVDEVVRKVCERLDKVADYANTIDGETVVVALSNLPAVLARALSEALAQQPAADPRSTHRVWRGDDWQPCYCGASDDHRIGSEQPAADQFIATFRCENNGIVGTTDAKVHSVTRHDDGRIEVVIDHWPKQPTVVDEAMTRRIMSEFHANDPGDVWPPDEQGRLRRKALQDAINNTLATKQQDPTT